MKCNEVLKSDRLLSSRMGDQTTWSECLQGIEMSLCRECLRLMLGGVIWTILCSAVLGSQCIHSRGSLSPINGKVVSAEEPTCEGEAEKWILHNFEHCQRVFWHYTVYFLRIVHKTL